jgi:outer membrane protein assembly factor BamB
MLGIFRSGKFSIISLILLSLIAGGGLSVSAFQTDGAREIKPWEKPIPQCWSYEAEILLNIPLVSNAKGFLFIPLSDGAVAAVDTATGKQTWHTGLGGEIQAIGSLENGKLVVMTQQEGEQKDNVSLFLQALSDESGITAWRRELDLSGKFFLLGKANSVFVIGEEGGVTAFNAASGEILWQSNAGGKLAAAPVLSEKSLIIGTADKKLLEISAENGKILQTYSASATPGGPIAVTNEAIVYSDQIGNIYALRLSNGEFLWKARAGAEVTDISVTEQGVLVSSNDNFAYMLSPNRGDRKWKRKFSGRLTGKPVLRENYGLFVTAAGKEAVVLNLSNGKFVNNVSLLNEAFFTGGATSNGSNGGSRDSFALSTSQGLVFYDPNGCVKK